MWEDKNTKVLYNYSRDTFDIKIVQYYKVRKEVIEVLGDVGKRHPAFIPLILQSIDVDSSNSLMVRCKAFKFTNSGF